MVLGKTWFFCCGWVNGRKTGQAILILIWKVGKENSHEIQSDMTSFTLKCLFSNLKTKTLFLQISVTRSCMSSHTLSKKVNKP